jgi:hypothetical protein
VKDFTLFFGGAEQQGWRRLLAEQDAAMSLSFRGLLRRMPKTKPYLLADRLAGEYPLLLDSGAHSFNAAKSTPDRQELLDFAQRYETFVEANTDRPTLITEFDSRAPRARLDRQPPEAFYDHLEPSKFMPVWHAEWGIPTAEGDGCEVRGHRADGNRDGYRAVTSRRSSSRSRAAVSGCTEWR